MDVDKELKKTVGRYFQAYCLSEAILEDYSKVVAKMEGVEEEQVKERIRKRMKEIAKEAAQEHQ